MVSFQLKNVETGEWVPVEAEYDNGSDVTNFPDSWASRFGISLWRESIATIQPVSNELETVRIVPMEMMLEGQYFSAPIVFRRSNVPPLLGRSPIDQYFNVLIDNADGKIVFQPFQTLSSIAALKTFALKIAGLFGGEKE